MMNLETWENLYQYWRQRFPSNTSRFIKGHIFIVTWDAYFTDRTNLQCWTGQFKRFQDRWIVLITHYKCKDFWNILWSFQGYNSGGRDLYR